MKKIYTSVVVGSLLGAVLFSGSASGGLLPTDDQFVAGGFRQVSGYGWSVTDSTSADNLFGTFVLTLKDAALSVNDFGIYTLGADGSVAAKWQIFDINSAPGGDGILSDTTDATVFFKQDSDGNWMVSDRSTGGFSSFGKTFGFYSTMYDVGSNTVLDTWYSESSRNSDAGEHLKVMIKDPNLASIFIVNDLQGAQSAVNVRVRTNDLLSPAAAVPEPATMGLFGFGLLGVASLFRRRQEK